MAEHQEEAEKLFENLLENFPNSSELYRVYAGFVESVFGNRSMRDVLLAMATDLEESRSKDTKALSGLKGIGLGPVADHISNGGGDNMSEHHSEKSGKSQEQTDECRQWV